MIKWRLASSGTLIVLSSGCATQNERAPLSPTLGPEWQCFATASALDAPGTIFRRDDRNGAAFGTIDLSPKIGVRSAELTLGSVTTQFTTSLGLAANLLHLRNGATGNASAQPPKTYRVSAAYKDALKEVTSDVDADRAKKWFATYSGREAGFTYFFIREAVAAKDLRYTLSADLIADLGGEATVSQQLTVSLPAEPRESGPAALERYTTIPLSPQGDSRLVWHSVPEVNGSRSYDLQMSFERPSHVCFRAERFVQTASGADGSVTVDLVPVAAPLEISSYTPMR